MAACKYVIKTANGTDMKSWEINLPQDFNPNKSDLENLYNILINNASDSTIQEIASIIENDAILTNYESLPVLDESNRTAVFTALSNELKPLGVSIGLVSNMDDWVNLGFNTYDKSAVSFDDQGKAIVYVNMLTSELSDPMHELMHIVLETARAMSPKEFKLIVTAIYNTKQGKQLLLEILKTKRYSNLPVEAQLEEVAVRFYQGLADGNILVSDATDVLDTSTPTKIGSLVEKYIKKTFGLASIGRGVLSFLQQPINRLSKNGSDFFVKANYATDPNIQQTRKLNVMLDNLIADLMSGKPEYVIDGLKMLEYKCE